MDPSQLTPGFRLDRYELLCPLAYGGMASVWLARFGGRKGFERLVVVKMILPQYSQDPRFQEMFLDEARIASRIEHANVARILDVGEQEDNTFIVMEWVDGDSLSKVVRAAEQKKQRVPSGIALRVCADAAAGLHAAHQLTERDGTPLGVVHRDVSPQNILISNSGTTVLIDFGVAKARDRVSQDTSAGQLKGKIRYMAPEQALGRVIDHRADVWALGAILYELFAGVPPYDGPNEVATLHKLTSGMLPAPLPSSVPAPIRAVIDRAIAYEPDDRYSTALELNHGLESALIEIGDPTTVAVVAAYTAGLLADRKAARKRAVDTALSAAHARIAESHSSMGMAVATPGNPMPSAVSRRSQTEVMATPPVAPPPNSGHEMPSRPSTGPMGLGETPSAASGATLGSASVEYLLPEPVDDPHRKRRTVAAAVLGVSIAAGLVGAVLIISTAVKRHEPAKEPGGFATQTAQTAPPEAQDPTQAAMGVTAPVASAGAGASADPVVPPGATATATAPPRTATPAAPLPIPTTTTAAAAAHRNTTPAAPTARPKPPPPPPPTGTTAKPPERGF